MVQELIFKETNLDSRMKKTYLMNHLLYKLNKKTYSTRNLINLDLMLKEDK